MTKDSPELEPNEARSTRPRIVLGPLVMAIAISIALIIVLYEAAGYGMFRVKASPILFGSVTLMGSLYVTAAEIARRYRPQNIDREARRRDDEKRFSRSEIQIFTWFGAYVASFLILGFQLGMAAFILAFLRFKAGESWRTALFATVLTLLSIYLVFIRFLGTRVYEGVLLPSLF